MDFASFKAEVAAFIAANPQYSGTDMAVADQIATAMSSGRTKYIERMVTERTIMSALGPVAGEAFISGLESFAAATLPEEHPLKAAHPGIARMLGWIKPGSDGINVGDVATQQLLSALVATGYLQQSSVDVIVNLSKVDDPVSMSEVYQAIQV